MFSSTLRNWAKHNKDFTSTLVLKSTTPVSLFKFTKIEARTRTKLEPIEWMVLKCADTFGKVSRIEVHAISGFQLHIIEEIMEKLEESGQLKIEDFDKEILHKNLSRLENELGDGWKTPLVEKLLERPMIIQYSLTDFGKKALKGNFKTLEEIIDLSVYITASPFKLFFGDLVLKAQSYEEIDVDAELANRVLYLAQQEGKKLENSIVPLAVTNETAIAGFEVESSNFWLLLDVEEEDDFSEEIPFLPFITSIAFVRWDSPSVADPLANFVRLEGTVKEVLSQALSKHYRIVKDLIVQGISLEKDSGIWTLVADLEMFKLIRDVDREPIEKYISEVEIDLYENWRVSLLLKLEPMEELDEISLFVARFHSRVDRQGFTEEQGYNTWAEILNEAGRKPKRKQYRNALDILLKHRAIKEEKPKIQNLVVNLDYLLSYAQRKRHAWKFNRIRILESLIKRAKIKKVYFYCTEELFAKIDETDQFNEWKKNVDLRVVEDIEESVRFAVDNYFHFIGIDEDNEEVLEKLNKKKVDKMKVGKRFIELKGDKNLEIPEFEPIFHWLPENILDKLYNEYYSD